jgi:hypothetical protein
MMVRHPLPNYSIAGYEWKVRPSPAWRVPSRYGKCRRPKCQNPPVADMLRARYVWIGQRQRSAPSWWAYCGRHLYGGWIRYGKVVLWQLVKIGDGDA